MTKTTPIMAEWAVRLLTIDKVGINLLWRGAEEMRDELVEPSSGFSRLRPTVWNRANMKLPMDFMVLDLSESRPDVAEAANPNAKSDASDRLWDARTSVMRWFLDTLRRCRKAFQSILRLEGANRTSTDYIHTYVLCATRLNEG